MDISGALDNVDSSGSSKKSKKLLAKFKDSGDFSKLEKEVMLFLKKHNFFSFCESNIFY